MSNSKMEIHMILTNECGDCEERLFSLGQEYPKAELENYTGTREREDSEYDDEYQVYVVYSGELDEEKVKKELKEDYDLDLED